MERILPWKLSHPVLYYLRWVTCVKELYNYIYRFQQKKLLEIYREIYALIIGCKCFFLFISQEPTTWPADNCLQIMVFSCAMSSNCVWLQIISFCSCVNECTLFSFLGSLLRKNGTFPEIFIKKQTRWLSDKTTIELGHGKISWFVSVSQINYLPRPSASANNWSINLLATNKSRNIAQPPVQ